MNAKNVNTYTAVVSLPARQTFKFIKTSDIVTKVIRIVTCT